MTKVCQVYRNQYSDEVMCKVTDDDKSFIEVKDLDKDLKEQFHALVADIVYQQFARNATERQNMTMKLLQARLANDNDGPEQPPSNASSGEEIPF